LDGSYLEQLKKPAKDAGSRRRRTEQWK